MGAVVKHTVAGFNFAATQNVIASCWLLLMELENECDLIEYQKETVLN